MHIGSPVRSAGDVDTWLPGLLDLDRLGLEEWCARAVVRAHLVVLIEVKRIWYGMPRAVALKLVGVSGALAVARWEGT